MRWWTRRIGFGLGLAAIRVPSEDMPFAEERFECQPNGQQQLLAWRADSDRRRVGHCARCADSETRLQSWFQREPYREMPCGRRHRRLRGQVDWQRGTSFHAMTRNLCR